VDVGTALLEIRDRRLYHATHERFDDYCMQAAAVMAGLQVDTNNCAPPQNEAQARELAPLVKSAARM